MACARALPLLLLASAAVALDNGVGRLPAMGWSSWNTFRCDLSEALILEVADALVSSGLRDAGYRYVNVDDCWMEHGRDAAGHLVVDAAKFPRGMKALGDELHQRRLLFGIYSAVRCAASHDVGRSGVQLAFGRPRRRARRLSALTRVPPSCAGGQQDVRRVRGFLGA
jgi:alpha-galactosidase